MSTIVLIGPCGVGKTTLGKMVAEHNTLITEDIKFYDIDDEIYKLCKPYYNVSDYFVELGARNYALKSFKALNDIVSSSKFNGIKVCALSCNALMSLQSKELLKNNTEHCSVIYLKVPTECAYLRWSSCGNTNGVTYDQYVNRYFSERLTSIYNIASSTISVYSDSKVVCANNLYNAIISTSGIHQVVPASI